MVQKNIHRIFFCVVELGFSQAEKRRLCHNFPILQAINLTFEMRPLQAAQTSSNCRHGPKNIFKGNSLFTFTLSKS